MIQLVLDLDNTTSKAQKLVSFRSKAARNQRRSVHIVSSRSDEPGLGAEPRRELARQKARVARMLAKDFATASRRL